MKHTGTLNVRLTPGHEEHVLVIHPNNGFDIGLMTYSNECLAFFGCTAAEFNAGTGLNFTVRIDQSNECRLGTVEMSTGMHKRLSNPEDLELVMHGGKLLILPLRCRV